VKTALLAFGHFAHVRQLESKRVGGIFIIKYMAYFFVDLECTFVRVGC
jgi:hypothetical protein